ncbi:hypothetical protein KJ632_02535 [Patescibacteria group bacterium]|nr:hypothetical protein [Patescibacteria group bacterium]
MTFRITTEGFGLDCCWGAGFSSEFLNDETDTALQIAEYTGIETITVSVLVDGEYVEMPPGEAAMHYAELESEENGE